MTLLVAGLLLGHLVLVLVGVTIVLGAAAARLQGR